MELARIPLSVDRTGLGLGVGVGGPGLVWLVDGGILAQLGLLVGGMGGVGSGCGLVAAAVVVFVEVG